MPAAKYQPVQDSEEATSLRDLYEQAAPSVAQSEAGFFPFIRSLKWPSVPSTECEAQRLPSPSSGPVGVPLGASAATPAAGSETAATPAASSDRARLAVVVPRRPHPRRPPDYRLQLLQQWECVVRSVSTDDLVAVLYDLTDLSRSEEEATFPLEEVSDSDRAFVEPGAVFYWSIGYRTSSTGQKERVSQIRFRRLPTWTAGERRDAEREASEFEELLGDDDR